MQSCLEKKGIETRQEQIVRSDYNQEESYSPTHTNALSDGDAKGKGSGHGGHTAWLPDCNKGTTMIDYSNFDTINGGGIYDIEGRNGVGGRDKALASSKYNKENEYGANLINTDVNLQLGQFQVK